MENDEIWKPISFAPSYMVSNHGRILSTMRGRNLIMKPGVCNDEGHLLVCLRHDGMKRCYLVHRIVGSHFLENPMLKPEIDHIDRNPANNHVSNLRWATRSENNINRVWKNKRCRYIGVSEASNRKGFVASICIEGTSMHLGTFLTAEDAARAYDEASRKYRKEFAILNFPSGA